MMPPRLSFIVAGLTLPPSIMAAIDLQQWPPIIIGCAVGTVATFYGIKNAIEDTRIKTLAKRMADIEVESEFRVTTLKDKLDESDIERRHLRVALVEMRERLASFSECPFATDSRAKCVHHIDTADGSGPPR